MKKKSHKMDPKLVSMQKHEINYVRLKFFSIDRQNSEIKHPEFVEISRAVKQVNHSRKKLYAWLKSQGWHQL